MKPVVVLPEAQRDIEATASYYEAQKEGLGSQFIDRVEESLERIKIAPEGYREVFKQYRRATLRQFRDQALWYRVLPDNSVVVACLSSRMSPEIVREIASGVRPIRKPEP